MRRTCYCCVVAAAISLVACGDDSDGAASQLQNRGAASRPAVPTNWESYESDRWGYNVRFPRDWRRASQTLTPKVSDPRNILALGTFPLRYRPTDCEAFAGSAQADLRSRDVLITVQERGLDPESDWRTFPQRPARFRLSERTGAGPSGCEGRSERDSYWIPFTDAGRHLYLFVAIGTQAPKHARRDALRVVDSLRFDPDVQPNLAICSMIEVRGRAGGSLPAEPAGAS